ncbi:MAG: fluoride efflux transporter CrcB [Mycobacterium sp.]|uniref:fluoride efflux transporter CrcB n=1 Tax=Mycobacterium sp. TaxID=1785 RepID=UPI00261D7EB7|nr:fluoride efflux transporter CrcB [Mycobacterium sp.]MDI3313284.1 fluoride efflux transporter CrcB [Mycobacterium sp.]
MAGYDYRALAAVFAGGMVGTFARSALTASMPAPDPTRWPWSTFTANIAGALLIGYFTTRLLERLPVSSYRRPFLGTGVCGGLTTFSTMQIEIVAMIEHQKYLLAGSYSVANVVLGLLAVYLATGAVRRAQVQ